MAAGAGRQRYRWLLLLLAAVLLLAWAVTGGLGSVGSDGDAGPTVAVDRSSASSSPSPTPDDPGGEPTSGATTDPASGLPLARLGDLPPEAARTVDLIERGGPFPEPEHDGGVFGNREELLPDEDYGYYREYTVPTPGSPDRGARRIIAGDGGELYWTADHYASFARIVVGS